MKLADGCTLAEVCSHFTVDEAVKALRPAPTPAPAIEEHPVEHPVEEHVVEEEHPVDLDPEAVAEEVAAEAEREHPPVPVIVDEPSEIQTLRKRHREDVAAVNTERRATAAERRKNRDICDALLASPTCPNCDAVLARFWSAARPAA